MIRFQAQPDGFTVITIAGSDAQGNPTLTQTAFKYDDKAYPSYSQTSLGAFLANGTKTGTFAHKLTDPYTMVARPKNPSGVAGNPVTIAVSRDRKTMTQTTKGTNAQGQAFENVVVYDRVK